ncbi:MAG: TolC family protein [Bacteroidota bacterium]|nr:TolC family protein [Bacteroidota bacterium]
MRYFLMTLLLLSKLVQAQTPLYRADSSRSTDIREKLVQLAMQNPAYEIVDHAALAASYQVKIAQSGYLGLLAAQGNINEYTVNPPRYNNQTIPFYYPKYNLGINIPFNVFAIVPITTKIAKEKYYIAAAEKNEKFREIRADVLTKYENYLLARQLVELQGKIVQGEYATLKRLESDFAENLIKLEEVERQQKIYINEQVRGLTLQKDLNVTKIELEKIIGVRIEDVERSYK